MQLLLFFAVLVAIGAFIYTTITSPRPPSPFSEDELSKKFKNILGVNMAYHEQGSGAPIVFLHGNPTSSYLWRNIIPHMKHMGRCIAPDLVGMGDSGKLSPVEGDHTYTFENHKKYLFALLKELGVGEDEKVTLVIHDWGSVLGFTWARENPDKVRGIIHMESVVAPFTYDDLPIEFAIAFGAMRTKLIGKAMVMYLNFFIEFMIPKTIVRELSSKEMDVYRKPYPDPESRRPLLTWPRQIPFIGNNEINKDVIMSNQKFLNTTQIPKLFFQAMPGAIMNAEMPYLNIALGFPNQKVVKIVGKHYVQEDSPYTTGKEAASWLSTINRDM